MEEIKDTRSRDGLSKDKTKALSHLTFLLTKDPPTKLACIICHSEPCIKRVWRIEALFLSYLSPVSVLDAKLCAASAINSFLSLFSVSEVLLVVLFLLKISPPD